MYIEEFLYRGRDATNEPGKPSTWHVVIATWEDDGVGGKKCVRVGPMTPGKALASGLNLQGAVGGINAAALIERDAAVAALEQALEERDAARVQLAALVPGGHAE